MSDHCPHVRIEKRQIFCKHRILRPNVRREGIQVVQCVDARYDPGLHILFLYGKDTLFRRIRSMSSKSVAKGRPLTGVEKGRGTTGIAFD